nr:MAG TPA: hypothetical protein [Caudoviricetes sp.]
MVPATMPTAPATSVTTPTDREKILLKRLSPFYCLAGS